MEFIDIYDNLGQKCGMTLGKEEAHKKHLFIKGFVYGLLILMMRYYFKLEVIMSCSQIC